MIDRPFTFHSVNVRRGPERTAALLQTDNADFLLIQEPWWGTIGTGRSDTNPDGAPTKGFTSGADTWDTFAPNLNPGETPKVVAFVRKTIARECVVINDASHPAANNRCLVLNITHGHESLRVVNYYHHVVDHRPSIRDLTAHDFDPALPTILVGDFNTHSHSWSIPGRPQSTWAEALEDWFEAQTLTIASPTQTPTRCEDGHAPSVLDLLLVNTAASWSDQVYFDFLSFSASLASDHALLSFTWAPEFTMPDLTNTSAPRWKVTESLRDHWQDSFSSLPQCPPLTDTDAVLTEAARLTRDIANTNDIVFDRARPGPARGFRWWDDACTAALTTLRQLPYGGNRRHAHHALRTTIRRAKREWAEAILTDACNSDKDLWGVAKWRKGRRSNVIPPLRTPDGTVSGLHSDMSASLRTRFFPPNPIVVSREQHTDPPPCHPRAHHPITHGEIHACLKDASPSSAPGPSGLSYRFLQWAFAAAPERFIRLYNACLDMGTHPWKEADVVVIPKPGKPDYSAPKAYRPISLLECCGKLLEKVITRRILYESNSVGIISPHQFGSRDYHCAVDAVLCVTHNAESVMRSGRAGALILFDIQGFFDNIDGPRTVRFFELMGFSHQTCSWVASFLSPRSVSLRFNGTGSSRFPVSTGTPQGSPLSPVLSAIYTTVMLSHFNSSWTDKTVNLYVDDGALFASGPTIRTSFERALAGLHEVLQWLANNGLRTDPDKTELMLFYPPRASPNLIGSPPLSTCYIDPFSGPTEMKPADQVRYLGVFITRTLKWKPHVTIMANRARSAIRSLSILGNSVRGLRFATWRRLFHSIIIPIMTYGCPVWFPLSGTSALAQPLQVAQNDGLRKIAGAFRTTPIDPLHNLLAIPPISLTLRRLVLSYSDRLATLPPTHLIRTILDVNPAANAWSPFRPPSTLRRILRDNQRVSTFTLPLPTYDNSLVHDRITPLPTSRSDASYARRTRDLISHPHSDTYSLFITEHDANDFFHTAWSVFRGLTPMTGGAVCEHSRMTAILAASAMGIESVQHGGTFYVFLPVSSPGPYLLRGSDHPYLTFSLRIIQHLRQLLLGAPGFRVAFRWFAPSWACARRILTHGATLIGDGDDDAPLAQIPDRKADMYRTWSQQYVAHHHPAYKACTPPDGNLPPPFIRGVLSRGSRRLFSTAVQIATGHSFSADYSSRFRPTAPDNRVCPCSSSTHPVNHTAEHVLFHCPTHADIRLATLPGRHPGPHLFKSFVGGYTIADFLWSTQTLAYPLPPATPRPPDPLPPPSDPPWELNPPVQP
jgi:endonuclease/exonuclease/phosphatase family metal-dependent hydrolase